MNPQGPIVTTIPYSNMARNCDIFDLVIRTLDLAYRGLTWHRTMKSESKKLRGNKIFENAERRNNFEVEKFGRKNSVNWNQTNSILNWNHKYPESIHVDPNHT